MTVMSTSTTKPPNGMTNAISASPKPMAKEIQASLPIAAGFRRRAVRGGETSDMGAGRGTASMGDSAGTGTFVTAPHRLQRDRRPARLSSAWKDLPQPTHVNAIISRPPELPPRSGLVQRPLYNGNPGRGRAEGHQSPNKPSRHTKITWRRRGAGR